MKKASSTNKLDVKMCYFR